jgi:arylsulfatase A-like enzyme
MMQQLDLQVGRVLQTLARTGLDKNTVVVFTSDNGGERFSDNWPFSGRKAELLEGGIRVPAIVRWPGRIPAGRTTAQVAISMDWMPTFLKLAGVAPAPSHPLDGIDLSPFLLTAAPPVPRKLFWRHRYNAQRAMRDGDMKWLSINGNKFLFNLAQDPQEKANLKDKEPAVHARMEKEFAEWNQKMLPEDPAAYTYGFPPNELADRYKNQ